MALVDVVLTISPEDQPDAYDFELLDTLDQMYVVTHAFNKRTLGSYLDEALKRSKASSNVWLGRRPLILSHALHNNSKAEEMLILLPIGSTFRAANAAYSWLQVKLENHVMTPEEDSDMRHFAHTNIIPLLDTRGELSRFEFDVKIAYDLMYVMKHAMGRGRIGRPPISHVESVVIEPRNRVDLGDPQLPRETRQLAIRVTYKGGAW